MKRYLITFSEPSADAARRSMQMPPGAVLEGLDHYATDAADEDRKPTHFAAGIVAANLTDADVAKLANESSVNAIEEDIEMHALRGPLESWPVKKMRAPKAWKAGFSGKGIKVAVLDTGGDKYHNDLVFAGGINFLPGQTKDAWQDLNGHGTHCAGVIRARPDVAGITGIAHDCELYAVSVLDASGSGRTSGIIAGVMWAADNGMKVVSMSLGSASPPMVAYNKAIQYCLDKGCVVVCAAGNSGESKAFPYVNCPANSPFALSVGAVDIKGGLATFSSRGRPSGQKETQWNGVTVTAPGVRVRSTVPGNKYKYMSGTSMATPHVAAVCALLWQKYPNRSAYEIARMLMGMADNGENVEYKDGTGFGFLTCDFLV